MVCVDFLETVTCLANRVKLASVIAILIAAAGSGCGQQDIKIYRVAKETSTAPEPAVASTASAAADASPTLKWDLPAGWSEVPPGEMRLASFRVNGANGKMADVSIVPLAGTAGGDLANVNRWRDQVSLQPVGEQALSKLAEPLQIDGQAAQVFDFDGKNQADEKTRILTAVQHRAGTAWFFKMTGDSELVGQQKDAFMGFLKSVRFQAASAQAQLPSGHPPIDSLGTASAVSDSTQSKPAWQVPSGWHEIPGGQFLVAKFAVGTADAPANVNVSMSAGEGGGLVANANRWRGQLGLQPLAPADLEKQAKPLELTTGKAILLDMTGADPKSGRQTRLLGAMVWLSNVAWFYKLMGDERIVEQQKEAFTKFVQSAKYP